MNKRIRLRKLLDSPEMIVAPGAPDALTARIIEKVGFECCYMGGNGVTASKLGFPDIGLTTATEMLERARNINACIDLPLICDADTGYGNVNNVHRTVRDFEQAGIAAIHLEDQATPKKCGAMDGLELTSFEESVSKIRAAVQSRSDPNFLIIARTDSRAAVGLDESIRRIQAFEAAGADVVYVEMLETADEIRRVVQSVKVPVLYDVLERRKDAVLSNAKLKECGVKIATYPMSAILFMAKSITSFMEDLKREGSTQGRADELMDLHEYEKLLGIDGQIEFQLKFSGGAGD